MKSRTSIPFGGVVARWETRQSRMSTNNPPRGDRSAGFYIKIYFNWILIDSGLKLLLYGTRIRINYSSPGNIWKFDVYNFLISWKYWKSGFSNFLVAWKYWKLDFSNFLVAWKYWNSEFFNFLISWKYSTVRSILSRIPEIVDRTIHISVLSWK